jgi:hypothetical protein
MGGTIIHAMGLVMGKYYGYFNIIMAELPEISTALMCSLGSFLWWF